MWQVVLFWRGKFQVDPKNRQPFIATGYLPQRPGVICDPPVIHVIAKGEGQKLPTHRSFSGDESREFFVHDCDCRWRSGYIIISFWLVEILPKISTTSTLCTAKFHPMLRYVPGWCRYVPKLLTSEMNRRLSRKHGPNALVGNLYEIEVQKNGGKFDHLIYIVSQEYTSCNWEMDLFFEAFELQEPFLKIVQ